MEEERKKKKKNDEKASYPCSRLLNLIDLLVLDKRQPFRIMFNRSLFMCIDRKVLKSNLNQQTERTNEKRFLLFFPLKVIQIYREYAYILMASILSFLNSIFQLLHGFFFFFFDVLFYFHFAFAK